jgi:hypothetical protein
MGMKVNGTSGLTFPDTTTLASAGQASVRAWVNFDGTGTVAIRASYNVASITDNGTGQYTVNFTTAMPDANYSSTFGTTHSNNADNAAFVVRVYSGGKAAGSLRVLSTYQATASNGPTDVDNVNVAIFR